MDSTSLCPKEIVKVTLEINDKPFEHTFIMCQTLKQPLLFCMDFTPNFRIGIEWDHNGVSYLRHRGRKLISAWPNGSISNTNYMTRGTFHVIATSVALVTNDLGIRLKTPTIVTILPHITMLLLEPPFKALQCQNSNTELFEVVGNPLLSIEQPYLLILQTLHTFDTRYPEQCVLIAVNVSDEDIILNKGMTLCFVQEIDLTIKSPHVKEIDTINMVNNKNIIGTKRERL